MKISEIIVESTQLNESVVLTEGAKDIFKKIMLGATFAAAAAGASAQDAASFLAAVKKNPEQAQKLFANNPEAMKQIAAMSRTLSGQDSSVQRDRSSERFKQRADDIMNKDMPHSKSNRLGTLKAYADSPQATPEIKKRINDLINVEKSSIDKLPQSFKTAYNNTSEVLKNPKYQKTYTTQYVSDEVKSILGDLSKEAQLEIKLKKMYDVGNFKGVSDAYSDFVGS